MNDTDRERLQKLCQTAQGDALLVFDEKTAYITTGVLTITTNISSPIYDSKVAITPSLLNSIINTMPEGEIKVRSLGDMKFKFRSGDYSRTVCMIDAESSVKIENSGISADTTLSNAKDIYDCIQSVMNFAHKNQSNVTSCVHVKISESDAVFVGTDGTIASIRAYKQKNPMQQMSFTMTVPQCQSVCRILSDDSVKAVRIVIDSTGKVVVGSKFGKVVLAKSTHEFKDFTSFLRQASVNAVTRKVSQDAFMVSVPVDEIKRALSSINSMFTKNEYPQANIKVSDGTLTMSSEVSTRGYDKFLASMKVENTGNLSVRISTVLLMKAITKIKENVNIYWSKSLDPTKAPLCIMNSQDALVYFAPISIAPKEED